MSAEQHLINANIYNGTYGFQYFYIVMLDVRIMHKVSHTEIIMHTSKYGNYKFTSDQSSSIFERAKSFFSTLCS